MASKKPGNNLRARVRWGIVGILVLLVGASVFDAPAYANKAINFINNTVAIGLPQVPEKPFRLGLDLQGGAQLIYGADVSAIPSADQSSAVDGVRDVIEKRVNGLGVSEPTVQVAKVDDNYRIIVELPGIGNVGEAISLIGETPILEFKEQNNIPPRDLTADERREMEDFNREVEEKAQTVLVRAKSGEDFGALAQEFSEHEPTKNNGGYLGYLSERTADKVLYEWAKNNAEGKVSAQLVKNDEGLNILKRGAQRDGEVQVSASHILICYQGSPACQNSEMTKEQALERASNLFQEANALNFAELAKANSDDLGSKSLGGELGYFGKGVMVAEFEQAVFTAEAGQIIGPVETQFGYHIIYKTDEKVSPEYEVSRILFKTKTAADFLPSQDPWMNTQLSGSQLKRAEVVSDPQTGAVQVSLLFDSEGATLFKDITERNIGKPVAIFLDGELLSDPVVQALIANGEAVITGNFDLAEAKLLAQRLNAGALPVPVELISQQSIGASLGAESLTKSLQAGVIALVLVMLFMLVYYRLPGALSVISLLVYLSVVLAIFKLIGVTLTLAGIAGFVLSLGMAVDANVLIFERLKEELRSGKSLKAAVEEGFLRAWTSIRDGNVSTLITCALLIWFGSSFVKGFAITLSVGILVSMFSAITVTRVMLRFIIPWFEKNGSPLFLGFEKKNESEK